jgi:hypothetical protein
MKQSGKAPYVFHIESKPAILASICRMVSECFTSMRCRTTYYHAGGPLKRLWVEVMRPFFALPQALLWQPRPIYTQGQRVYIFWLAPEWTKHHHDVKPSYRPLVSQQ